MCDVRNINCKERKGKKEKKIGEKLERHVCFLLL